MLPVVPLVKILLRKDIERVMVLDIRELDRQRVAFKYETMPQRGLSTSEN